MLYKNVIIESIAHEDAPLRVTSDEIEDQIIETMDRLGIARGKIEKPSGIRERRFYEQGTLPSVPATSVALKAIDKAGITTDQIGALINASVTKDYVEPSVASLIHGNLRLPPTCINFDITNACLGFLNGMSMIANMIETNQIQYGLVISAENPRPGIESTIERLKSPSVTKDYFHENYAVLTLGCGAVAMVLAHRDVAKSQHSLEGMVNRAATEYNRLCVAQNDWMKTDSRALLNAGAELVLSTWKVAYEKLDGWGNGGVDIYLPHQVSRKQIETFINFMGVGMDKVYLILEEFGNMASAALPSALSKAVDVGRLSQGDHAGLVGIGSGINCSIMTVSW